MRHQNRWTEADAIAHAQRHGLALDPALTVPAPTSGMDPLSPEGVLEARLRMFAMQAGYLYYHTHNSQRSNPGYPDSALVHPDGGPLYLWELKSADGQVSLAQRRWLDALAKVTHVETGVYRPEDWATLQALLTRRPR
jgi:hypothetical protein